MICANSLEVLIWLTNCINEKININNITENTAKYIHNATFINIVAFAVTIKTINVINNAKNKATAINEQIICTFWIVTTAFWDNEYPINENTKQTTAAIPNATNINGAPNKKIIKENPTDWHSMNNIHTVNVNTSEWLNGRSNQIYETIEEININVIPVINTIKTRRFAKSYGLTAFKKELIQIWPKTNAKAPIMTNPIPAFKKVWQRMVFCFLLISSFPLVRICCCLKLFLKNDIII